MHRPAGLKVAAVLLVLFALLWVVTAVPLITVVVSYSYAHARSRYGLIAIDCAAEASVACFEILMGYAALGLARNRHSGRVAGTVAGILTALTAILLTVTVAAATLAQRFYLLPSPLRIGVVLDAIFFSAAAAFGLWLTVYLNLPRVKTWLRGTPYYIPSTVTYPSQTSIGNSSSTAVHSYAPVSARAPTTDTGPHIARILVWIFAILSLIGAVIMPLYVKWGIPLTFLGIRLQDRAAATVYICFTCVAISIAIGLIRRIPLAYRVALILETLGTMNRLLLLVPSYRLRASAFYATHYDVWRHYSPWSRIVRNAANGTLFILFLSLGAFFLWALWSDLNSIRQSRRPAAFHLPPIPEPELPL